jgi:nitroreductase
MPDKTADAPIHDLLAKRWSPRAFTDQNISEAQLELLLQAARWAPSCFNDQPWRFVVGLRGVDDARHEAVAGCLAGGNLAWAPRAPLLLIACAQTRFGHNDSENRWAAYDTGAAMMSLSLQAQAMGLHVHQMGGFDPAKAKEVFGLAETVVPLAAAAVGYAGEDVSHLPDWAAEREAAPRERKPLSDLLL